MTIFTNPKYVTIGVQENIPLALQLILWQLIAERPEPKDYLQVFRLFPFEGKQKLIHEQEEPAYHAEYLLNLEPIAAKIYCIDDIDHCTMLLAEEY